ncbi:MAG: Gfo/Idh/MocA family oxidoreductase [Bacteroidales bacterium]|jgi:UDP-N-acetyl-2-amino-2-deoxyglucuronate dehydrogenase|nr:Gfo/Idh/MocA family oxidoreductase [Bacteroidales bacterium]
MVEMMNNFALTGIAGFIAPRHLKAIKETGGSLLACYDPFDSVGILDSYFPHCSFTASFEEFEKQLAVGNIDYLSICSPNYVHKKQIIFGLQYGCDIICEKPLVLNANDIYSLEDEGEYGRKIFTILQLRLHPAIIALREKVLAEQTDKRFDVNLKYITTRGQWYYASWKGDVVKSGGLATNIGIHFFDMLLWIFGAVQEIKVDVSMPDVVSGVLSLQRANVKFFLSINDKYLPAEAVAEGKRTFRSLNMEGMEVEFSNGFNDLHTESYRRILAGQGFTLEDARPSIELVERIRNVTV